jgi:hypothetical protein
MLSEFNVIKSGKDGGETPTLSCTGIVFPEYSTRPTVASGIVKFKSERL